MAGAWSSCGKCFTAAELVIEAFYPAGPATAQVHEESGK
jgi:hypothetical protein